MEPLLLAIVWETSYTFHTSLVVISPVQEVDATRPSDSLSDGQ